MWIKEMPCWLYAPPDGQIDLRLWNSSAVILKIVPPD
jgi:hypothetical protein